MSRAFLAMAAGLVGLAAAYGAGAQDVGPVGLKLVCQGVELNSEPVDYHPRLAHEGGPAAGSDPARQSTPMTSTPGRFQVEISGATGRVRLPSAMAAAHHMEKVWIPLSNLVVGEEEITGRFKLSTFSSPHLRIDRTTGAIEVRGGGEFNGTCDAASDTPPQRKF